MFHGEQHIDRKLSDTEKRKFMMKKVEKKLKKNRLNYFLSFFRNKKRKLFHWAPLYNQPTTQRHATVYKLFDKELL